METVYDRVGRVQKKRVRKAPGVWVDTTYGYDRDGLTTRLLDANSNETLWLYDSRGLLQSMRYPEVNGGGQEVAIVDRDDVGRPEVLEFREVSDANARRVVWNLGYDSRGRLASRTGYEEPSTGGTHPFSGTQSQEFAYDDLGRMVLANDESDDSPGEELIQALFRYDSAGRMIEENQRTQSGPSMIDHVVGSVYDVTGFRTELHYPSVAGHEADPYWLEYTRKPRGQLAGVRAPVSTIDGTTQARARAWLTTHTWIGRNLWSRWYGNNTLAKGFEGPDENRIPLIDSLGRMTGMRTERVVGPGEPALIADFRYGYDRVGNPIYEQRRHEPTDAPLETATQYRTRAWTTDRLGRLDRWAEGGRGSADVIPVAHATDPAAVFGTTPDRGEDFALDNLGNWTQHTGTANGSSETTTLNTNALNQYASITPPGGDPESFVHDWLGQIRTNPPRGQKYVWDVFGRLTEVQTTAGVLIARYRYDALNRRVEKRLPPGTFDERIRYIYDGWRAIEERAVLPGGTEAVRARYGFGAGLDEVLWMDRDLAQDAQTDPDSTLGPTGTIRWRFYLHHDHKGSVIAATSDPLNDPRGNPAQVVERHLYSEYGVVDVRRTPSWDWNDIDYDGPPLVTSRIGLPYLYTGQRQDAETGLFYFKNRYYDPGLGRFLRRDLIGYADGSNLYAYAGANPVDSVDSLGLAEMGSSSKFGKVDWTSFASQDSYLSIRGGCLACGGSFRSGNGPSIGVETLSISFSDASAGVTPTAGDAPVSGGGGNIDAGPQLDATITVTGNMPPPAFQLPDLFELAYNASQSNRRVIEKVVVKAAVDAEKRKRPVKVVGGGALRGIVPTVDIWVRAFAPWESFGGGFDGDNRTFSVGLGEDVTSRLAGRVSIFRATGRLVQGSGAVKSSPSFCVGPPCTTFLGDKSDTGWPTIHAYERDGAIIIDMAGANPLLPSADIDVTLILRIDASGSISGSLWGNQFPNVEVFIVGPGGSAMLHTFATDAGPVTGPYFFLPGGGYSPMGEF